MVTAAMVRRVGFGALALGVASLLVLCGGSAGWASAGCAKVASPSGSDSASGSEGAPFRSPQRLIGALQAGETGCLRGGTYSHAGLRFNRGGAAGSPITLRSFPGERAKLVGGAIYVPAGSNHVTLQGLDIDGRSAGAASISVQLFGDYNRLLDSDVTNSHQSGSCITLSDYGGSYPTIVGAEIRGNHIHGCGLLSNGAHDHGIYVANARGHVVSDNVIEDIWAGWGIHLWTISVGGVFERNTIRASSTVASTSEGGVIMVAGASTHGNIFRSNRLISRRRNYVVDTYGVANDAATFSDNCIVADGAAVWESPSMDASDNRTVASEAACGPPPGMPPPRLASSVTITSLDGSPDDVRPQDGLTVQQDWICPTADAASNVNRITFTLDDEHVYAARGAPWTSTCWPIGVGPHILRAETDAGGSETLSFTAVSNHGG